MTRPCPGPRAVTSRPSWRAPPGAVDCHCHVFGPFDRYPLSPGRSYTPPEASVAQYLDMLGTIGLSRTVIVQPSIYGTENAVTLDAVEAIGLDRARAVVVVDDGFGAAELAAMAERGARGVRFNAVSGNGTPVEQLERLAERIAPLGWHVQLYAHGAEMVELEPVLRRLPVPVVVDHMGGVKAAEGGRGASRLPGAAPAAGRRRLGQALRLPLLLRPALRGRGAHGPRHPRGGAGALPCGARTGRIPRSRTLPRCRTTACCWTRSAPGRRTRGRGGRCWWTTRRGSTASRDGTLARGGRRRHSAVDDAREAARRHDPHRAILVPLVRTGGLGFSASSLKTRSRHPLAAFASPGPSGPDPTRSPAARLLPPEENSHAPHRSDYDFDVISGPATTRSPAPPRGAAPAGRTIAVDGGRRARRAAPDRRGEGRREGLRAAAGACAAPAAGRRG